ncbi:ricin-type beta-trefoil lectin domain protein [Streptomyces griseoloalbus]|uniref:ricin-type beta-trefoil lectin domain protein n=1 Tax=Streptomyces griseoloalbus TaxID=67303 RepID=UPI0033A1C62D
MSEQQQASSEPSAPKAAAPTPDAEAVTAALTGAGKPPTASAPEGTGAGRTAATEPKAGADTGAATVPTSSTGGPNAGTGATGRTSAAGDTKGDTEESSTGEKAQATSGAAPTAAQAASGDVNAGRDEKGTGDRAQGAGADETNGAQGLSAAATKVQHRAIAAAVDGGGATSSSRSGVGRPRKPVLAAAAIAGALLVAVPLLITATDEDEDKKAVDTASADTVLGAANAPAGVFDTQSPSPTKTEPEKKETKKGETKKTASAPPTVEKPAAPAAEPKPSPSQKKKAVVKKAPSTLPTVLTRVLIKNNTNHTCVDVPGFSSGQPNGPVTHATCNSNSDDNQLWNVERRYDKAGPGGVPLFQIRNVMDSMCLDLPGYQGVGGATKVTEFPCDGTTNDNQLWWLDKQSDGKFWIRNAASNNQCLDSYGPDDATRDLIVWPCAPEGQNNHEWVFTRS